MNKMEVLKELIKYESPQAEDIFVNNIKYGKNSVTLDRFLEILSRDKYNLKQDLQISASTATRLLEKLFPLKPKGDKACTWLLYKYGYKHCVKCSQTKRLALYSKNKARKDGIQTYCKVCMKQHQDTYYPEYYAENRHKYAEAKIRYYLALDRATPPWVDQEKLKQIYKNCPEGYHVDHIYPIQGKVVSGLHVPENLQYLTPSQNSSKSNKMPEDWALEYNGQYGPIAQ